MVSTFLHSNRAAIRSCNTLSHYVDRDSSPWPLLRNATEELRYGRHRRSGNAESRPRRIIPMLHLMLTLMFRQILIYTAYWILYVPRFCPMKIDHLSNKALYKITVQSFTKRLVRGCENAAGKLRQKR